MKVTPQTLLKIQTLSYDFEGGAFVKIVFSGDIETEEALDMVEILIDLKRKELQRRKSAASYPF